jgi:hypothetical protein
MTQTVKDANTYGPGRGPGALALSDEQLAQLFCAHRMGVSTVPGDDAGRELLGMQPAFERPADEAAFLQYMVADRRLVIRLRVSRLYGTAIDVPSGR